MRHSSTFFLVDPTITMEWGAGKRPGHREYQDGANKHRRRV
jgi:hypothetical protein